MIDDDLEIIEKIKNGNEDAYKFIVSKYQYPLQKYIYRIVGDLNDAIDITIETFADVFFKIKKFTPKAKFSTYLYKAATNKAINFMRKRKLFNKFKLWGNKQPMEYFIQDEKKELFFKALNMLNELERSAISLVYIENISRVEAAQILKINLNYLDVVLHRAREKLKKIVSG
ncbi:MAG: RNA polymerase sigma factor [bacterium]|nr:RNA polymerase sigma factor [bacterium]